MEYLYAYIILSYILIGTIFYLLICTKRKDIRTIDYVTFAVFFAFSPLTLIFLVISLDDIKLK